jgi:hypothetical protein
VTTEPLKLTHYRGLKNHDSRLSNIFMQRKNKGKPEFSRVSSAAFCNDFAASGLQCLRFSPFSPQRGSPHGTAVSPIKLRYVKETHFS